MNPLGPVVAGCGRKMWRDPHSVGSKSEAVAVAQIVCNVLNISPLRSGKCAQSRRVNLKGWCFESVKIVSLPKVRPKSEWVLTQAAFDGFLATLDSDRDKAGEKYEYIRLKLLKYFQCCGSDVPAK